MVHDFVKYRKMKYKSLLNLPIDYYKFIVYYDYITGQQGEVDMNGELKTVLTGLETRCLCVMLVQALHDGHQNTLTWKTREQLLEVVQEFVMQSARPDMAKLNKEALVFILSLQIYDALAFYAKEVRRVRKRAYTAIANRAQKY